MTVARVASGVGVAVGTAASMASPKSCHVCKYKVCPLDLHPCDALLVDYLVASVVSREGGKAFGEVPMVMSTKSIDDGATGSLSAKDEKGCEKDH